MSPYINADFEVTDIKKAAYKEIFFSGSDLADKWYKAKLAFITLNERTTKEKRTSVSYLINAGDINSAIKNIDDIMASTMINYQTCNVSETAIMDVFEHDEKTESTVTSSPCEHII